MSKDSFTREELDSEVRKEIKDKAEFISRDINRLLEYHKKAGAFIWSYSYEESVEMNLLNELYKKSKECKTLEELHSYITVLMSSRNPS